MRSIRRPARVSLSPAQVLRYCGILLFDRLLRVRRAGEVREPDGDEVLAGFSFFAERAGARPIQLSTGSANAHRIAVCPVDPRRHATGLHSQVRDGTLGEVTRAARILGRPRQPSQRCIGQQGVESLGPGHDPPFT